MNDINGVIHNIVVKNIGSVSEIQTFSHECVENQVYFLILGPGYKITCGFNFQPMKLKLEHLNQIALYKKELQPHLDKLKETILNEI